MTDAVGTQMSAGVAYLNLQSPQWSSLFSPSPYFQEVRVEKHLVVGKTILLLGQTAQHRCCIVIPTGPVFFWIADAVSSVSPPHSYLLRSIQAKIKLLWPLLLYVPYHGEPIGTSSDPRTIDAARVILPTDGLKRTAISKLVYKLSNRHQPTNYSSINYSLNICRFLKQHVWEDPRMD